MHPWLRAPYATMARLAEVIAAVTPATSDSKLGRAFAERRQLVEQYERWGAAHRDGSRPLLWIHAPSVGEGLMALPIIQRVRQELPGVQIVYTFFSPSAATFARQLDVDFTAYLPFDTAAAAAHILDALRPTALVFSKLDVWPVLVECAQKRGTRLGLISASMPAGSSRYGVGALFTHHAYAALDWVGAASTEDATRLIAAGGRPECVKVTGDTRYDQAWMRAHTHRQNVAIIDALRSDRVTLVAGSTWEADERHLFPAWERLITQVRGVRLIVAPHEIQDAHLRRIETWAQRVGLRCARLGASQATGAEVILVDRIGVLADLYTIADIAYVGGGFHTSGLHSTVEPAVVHVPVIVGPQHTASRDAQLMLNAGGAIAVQDSDDMTDVVQRLVTHPDARHRMATALDGVVSGQLGATARSFEIVREWVGTTQEKSLDQMDAK